MASKKITAEIRALSDRLKFIEGTLVEVINDATWTKAVLRQSLLLLKAQALAAAVTPCELERAENLEEFVGRGGRQDIGKFLRELELKDPAAAARAQAGLEKSGVLNGDENETGE